MEIRLSGDTTLWRYDLVEIRLSGDTTCFVGNISGEGPVLCSLSQIIFLCYLSQVL